MKQISFLFLFINALIFAQANVSYDTSFGNNGRVFTTNTADYLYPLSTRYKTIQNLDNKLISVSGSRSISRYNLDGTLDTTFGNAGTTIISNSSSYDISDLAILSDGSILVSIDNATRSYIFKYNSNGTLDTSFGTSGSLELIVANYENRFRHIKVLNDDFILIGGVGRATSTSLGITGIIKLDKNGNYDTSFSLDGKVILSSTVNWYNKFLGLDVDNSNNIYVGFQSNANGSSLLYGNVQKISATGNVISNFGNNGIASQFVNGDFRDMRVFPNGKILIAGTSVTNGTNDLYLVVLNTAGLPDTSNGTGFYRYDIDNNSNDYIEKIVIIDNNTFYLTGYIITGGISYGIVLKLNSSFTLDTNFNYTGMFATSYFSNKSSSNYHLTIQKDKKLLLSGAGIGTANNSTSYIGLIRVIDTKLLATNEIKKVNNISIYPNPASNVINLQTDKSLVGKAYDIVDMTGKSVIRNKVSDKEINISSLTTGNYILKVNNESYKFIKK